MSEEVSRLSSGRRQESGEVSLYQQIRLAIEQKIFSKEWLPGHRIPYEHELMVQFNCSRMTVSKAISLLVEAGLLERNRKAGTFVVHPTGHTATLRIPDIRKAVQDAGHHYHYQLVNLVRRRSTPADIRRLGLDQSTDIIEIDSVHLADTRPFAFEERLINLKTEPEAADVDFAVIPPSIWLLSHVPWTNAEHDIEAIGADAGLANTFGIEPGAPCLRLERRTWGARGTITHAFQTFPADALKLHARFLVSGT